MTTIEVSSSDSNADDAGQGVHMRLQHGAPGQSTGTKPLYSEDHVPQRYKDDWGGDMESYSEVSFLIFSLKTNITACYLIITYLTVTVVVPAIEVVSSILTKVGFVLFLS